MSSSSMFYCESEEFSHPQIIDEDHFLEACFMCQKSLDFNRDIFMYRGNTAFCSNECRQEQIERDEGKKRRRRNIPAGSTVVGKDARSTVAGAVVVGT